MSLNPSKVKNKMPMQDASIRSTNFNEVNLGYSLNMAIDEANRCLNCKNAPCVKGCPVNINIPKFIGFVKENNINEAYKVILESSYLPSICGRVCPQENQCEKMCTRGIAINAEPVGIGYLERYVADNATLYSFDKKENNGIKIAVIGSGPAGLSCAGSLAKLGYDVTIFESLHLAGGVLTYGIPEFRLPKEIVKKEIEKLKILGVKIVTDFIVGKTISLENLQKEWGFAGVFIGTGAGLPKFMGIKGENFNGVFSANEFLTRINLMKGFDDKFDTPFKRYKKIAVVGGGNVAMDAVRCAKRLGAEAYLIYRRTENEMPARKEEVLHAKEEDIIFKFLTNPVEIIGDENFNVKSIKCVEMELGEEDQSGRRSVKEKENSEFLLDVDCVIMALGTSPNPLLSKSTKDLEINKRGCIVVNEETNETSIKNVYAGGDAVSGAATVILAMESGKKAAYYLDKALSEK